MSHKITPFIRCTDNAQELVDYYLNIFPGSKITKQNPFVINFEIFGQSMAALAGGPKDGTKPNPSISFSLRVTDLEFTKQLRDKLSEDGIIMMEFGSYPRSDAYGRCSDKFGVSRQVMHDNRPNRNNEIVPSLMYTGPVAGKAEEAINFYAGLFPNSSVDFLWRYEASEPDKEGTINHAEFKLAGQQFIAMDSAMDHKFNFNNMVSLSVSCIDQEEVDKYRNALTGDGGSESPCGRCKDKYGVAWQIIPVQLPDALFDPDPAKAKYAMDAMMKMKKIVIEDLYEKK